MLALRRIPRVVRASQGSISSISTLSSRLPRYALPTLGKLDKILESPHHSGALFSHYQGFRFYNSVERSDSNPPVAKIKKPEEDEEKLSKIDLAAQVTKTEVKLEDAKEVAPPKKTIWVKVKEGVHHYWVGTKLLVTEFKISGRLLNQILKGKELTRRERKQLLRTSADLFRLVPFIVIVIVPFAEFALPFLLRFFPNVLPSTYEHEYEKEEKIKKVLQARLETARFFQETLEEMALVSKKPEAAKFAEAFSDFFKKIRMTGQQLSNKDIMTFAKLFKDELTLDNLSRPQIVSMCKYMNITAFGTTSFLRSQLRKRFKELREDDLAIQKEGVDSLNVTELQQACQSRGMRTIGVSSMRLRNDLQQWIDLRLKEQVPASLLVLARALTLQDQIVEEPGRPNDLSSLLQTALSSLPDSAVKELQLDVSETEGKSENAQKLSLIKEQEELIKAEKAEHEEAVEQQKKETLKGTISERIQAAKDRINSQSDEATRQIALAELKEIEHEASLTKEEIASLSDAIQMVSSHNIVAEERKDLEELKADRKEYSEVVDDLKRTELDVSKASTRLSRGVEKMVKKIESDLSQLEKESKSIKLIHPDFKGEVSYQDIEKVLTILKKKPKSPEALKRIFEEIDINKDGRISIEEFEKYADSLEDVEGVGEVKKTEK